MLDILFYYLGLVGLVSSLAIFRFIFQAVYDNLHRGKITVPEVDEGEMDKLHDKYAEFQEGSISKEDIIK